MPTDSTGTSSDGRKIPVSTAGSEKSPWLGNESEMADKPLSGASTTSMADKPLQFEVKKADVPKVSERQGIAMSELGK